MRTRKTAAYRFGEAADMRLVNDAIAVGAETLRSDDVPFDFYCECGDPRCTQVTQLTLKQYRIRPAQILGAHRQAA